MWDVLNHHEIWVERPDGGHYVSPPLIVHFVSDHEYAPPAEYVNAVMALKKL